MSMVQKRSATSGALLLVFQLVLALGVPDRAAAQVGSAADFLALESVLQQIDQSLDAALNTANTASADRIHQAEIAVNQTITNLQAAIQKVQNGISVQREEIYRQTFDTISQVNTMIQDSSRVLYLDVNSTLVSAATVIGAIPGLGVDSFVFAADPLRLRPNANDTLVSFYGYFPNVRTDGDATVAVGTESYPMQRYAGNRIAFKLPRNSLGLRRRATTLI